MAEAPENALMKTLLADSAVSTLIGTRLYPGQAPEKTKFPYGIYEASGWEHEGNMSSASGLTQGEVEVHWYSRKRSEAINMADAAREALDGFPRGTVTVDGTAVVVEAIRLRETTKGVIPPPLASSVPIHFVTQEYWMATEESIPTFS